MISPYQNNPQSFLDKFSMIFATSTNGMIGKDNKLLWHLPNDLKKFKELTNNRIVIMGRRTFESLPKGALPGRLNIVLCNDDEKWLNEPCKVETPNTGLVKLSTVTEVFNLIHNYELKPEMKNIRTDEFFVIGGGVIYNLFLPYVKHIYMTYVDVEIDGDTSIPNLDKYEWEEIESVDHLKDEKHQYNYTFLKLKKIGKNEQN